MMHPQQDEIRRLVENWAMWTGDQKGAVYSVSPIAWTEMAYAKLEVNRSRIDVIKPIGADAQLTGEALAAMGAREARALKAYCLSSLTAEMIAREHLRCSTRTYQQLVAQAHSDFWEAYCRIRSGAAAYVDEVRRVRDAARP